MFTYIKYIYLILLNLIYFSYGNTEEINNGDNWDNATWVLNSAFVIITMQSGFGLLESGTVTQKNSINIMMKNLCDIIFGGIIYWIFGYGLIFYYKQIYKYIRIQLQIYHVYNNPTDPLESGLELFERFSLCLQPSKIFIGKCSQETEIQCCRRSKLHGKDVQ